MKIHRVLLLAGAGIRGDMLRLAFEAFLRQDVVCTACCLDALELLHRSSFDIIVIDLDHRGPLFVDIVRESVLWYSRIPILGLSRYKQMLSSGMVFGCSTVLQKPYASSDLVTTFARALGNGHGAAESICEEARCEAIRFWNDD